MLKSGLLDLPLFLPSKGTNILIIQILGVVFTFSFSFIPPNLFLSFRMSLRFFFLYSHCYRPFGRV